MRGETRAGWTSAEKPGTPDTTEPAALSSPDPSCRGGQRGGRLFNHSTRGKGPNSRGRGSNASAHQRRSGPKRKVSFFRYKSNYYGGYSYSKGYRYHRRSQANKHKGTNTNRGKLSHCLSNWQRITSDQIILERAKCMKIDFIQTPLQEKEFHLSLDKAQKQQINLEIQKPLDKKQWKS